MVVASPISLVELCHSLFPLPLISMSHSPSTLGKSKHDNFIATTSSLRIDVYCFLLNVVPVCF